MKKKNPKPTSRVTPEEAVQFLEDIRLMASGIDEPTVPICIRVPSNLLRAVKTKAKADGKKYQSLMIEMLRTGIRKS